MSPDDETERSRYAARLAGQGRSDALDELTALAARLLGTESSQVSLISDHQVVTAAAGGAAPTVGVRSPADDSLCTVTLREGVSVLVEDAVHDDRVAQLPPVTTGAVRSYLGVPLVAAGHLVGSLCVHDPRPRAWSTDDLATLEALAQPVVAELELARLEADYREERAVWQLAIDAGGVGAFDWDLVSGELRWDDRLLELFGLDRASFGGTIEAFNDCIHPDDLDPVTAALTEAVETSGEFTAQYRVVHPDGTQRWISARGRTLPGPDGSAVRLIGAASDTTAAQEEGERVLRVLESIPTAFFHLDTQWRFTYANAEAQRLLGLPEEEIVGGDVWGMFPAATGSEFETAYRGAMQTGDPVSFEAYYPAPLDAWYEVRAYPLPDGLSVYFLDVSDRRAVQEATAALATRTALLNRVTQTLTTTLDASVAVAAFAQLVAPELGDWCLVTLVGSAPEDGGHAGGGWRHGLRDVGSWHADERLRPLVQRYAELRIAALTDESFLARALEGTGAVVALDTAGSLTAAVRPGEAHEVLAELAPAAAALVPLCGRERTVGVLTVFRGPGRDPFTASDLGTLEEAAGRAGLALDNARMFSEQRDLAVQLQQSMLTAPPAPDHLEIAVRYLPAAQAAQVGGDWYDAFLQDEGATVVVIGDVIGHDTAAAAAMGQLRSILRGVAVATGAAPADLLQQVDRAMLRLELDTSATVVAARFEQTPEERDGGLTRLRWANAGHPPPLLVEHPGDAGTLRATVRVLWGERANTMLGFDPTVQRDETVLTLARGSTVVFYTDGLIERRGRSLDQGIDELARVLGELVAADTPLEELCDEVLHRLVPEQSEDDVALLAVRLHPEDQPRPPEAGPRRTPPDVPPPLP